MKVCLVPTIGLPFPGPKQYVPLGLLSLHAMLRGEPGVDVRIFDVSRDMHARDGCSADDFYNEVAAHLSALNAALYGFSTKVGSFVHTLSLCVALKCVRPDALIAIGGPQASAVGDTLLDVFPFVDLVVHGEAEETFLHLCRCLRDSGDLGAVDGITFRQHGRSVRNNDRALLPDLNGLPFPSWELYEALLPEYAKGKPEDDIQSYVPVETSRGCRHDCCFCYSHAHWRRACRLKSVPKLVAEIEQLQQRFNVHRVFFPDDMFTGDRARVRDFCRQMEKKALPVQWCCYARIDSVDRVLLALMRHSGCFHIYYGIESGAPRILKSLGKPYSREQAVDIVDATVKQGIKATASLIIGAVCHDILDFSARVVDSLAGQLWRYRHERLTCSQPES